MNIGIDIDDVMCETIDSIKKIVGLYGLNYTDDVDRDLLASDLTKTEISRRFFSEHAMDIFEDVKLKPFVKEVMEKLHNDGHKLIIITSRSNTYLGDSQKYNEEFFKENGIYYDKLFTCESNKLERCKSENIDLMIDDSIFTCERVREGGINSVVFTSEFNKDKETNCDRVVDWNDLYNYIKNMQKSKILK